MKIVLLLCCMMVAMLLHPPVAKNQSGASFRTINISQTESGYTYFNSLAITSSEDFKAFLEEISQQQLFWTNREAFVDALLKAEVDFNREALVLLRYDDGYGGFRIPFQTPVLQDETLLCELRSEHRGVGLDIVAHHCFALAVSKALVKKVQFKSVGSGGERDTIVLSTTERQPLKMARQDKLPPKPPPSECPKLIIGCPTDVLETGKTYLVKLLVEGGDLKDDVTYNWSVSGAQIVGGQGTRSLAIRINHPNKMVEAWVSLGGVHPDCNAVTSCSAGPTK